MALVIPPAAPVTKRRCPSPARARSPVGSRSLVERDRPAQAFAVADLDDPGVAQRFLQELAGDLVGRRQCGDVHDLDERRAALALVRLGESGDAAAERRGRAIRSLAVQAAHAGRGDEESALGVTCS